MHRLGLHHLQFRLPPRNVGWALLAITLFTISYIVVYQLAPFPAPWSDWYTAWATVVAAAASAVFSTFVWRSFQAQDAPRRVWKYFSLGLWAWALAELIWAIYYIHDPEVPEISWATLAWVIGYILYAVSFVYQFRLLFHTNKRQEAQWLSIAVGATLALTAVVTTLLKQFGPPSKLTWIEAYVNVFYSFADLATMLAALALARQFGRGLWGQAWIGLMVFTVSDSMYTWLTLTGQYAYSLETGNPISLFSDTLYLDAYLLVALAFYIHFLLITYGPTLQPRVDAPELPET